MAAPEEGLGTLLDRVRTSMGRVTAQEVLDELTSWLRGRFRVDRASIRVVVPDTPLLELVAVWTSGETSLAAGTRMSSGSTAYPRVLSTGRPELRTIVDPREGLLDEIMSTEGIQSYVTIPLRDGARVIGLFSLSSREPRTFAKEDLAFLEEVADVVRLAVAKPS